MLDSRIGEDFANEASPRIGLPATLKVRSHRFAESTPS
jgi:hypothetical protein